MKTWDHKLGHYSRNHYSLTPFHKRKRIMKNHRFIEDPVKTFLDNETTILFKYISQSIYDYYYSYAKEPILESLKLSEYYNQWLHYRHFSTYYSTKKRLSYNSHIIEHNENLRLYNTNPIRNRMIR